MPLNPLLPLLSVFVNIYLLFTLSLTSWIRFAVWLVIGNNLKWWSIYLKKYILKIIHLGLFVYIFYGVRNSKQKNQNIVHIESNNESKIDKKSVQITSF